MESPQDQAVTATEQDASTEAAALITAGLEARDGQQPPTAKPEGDAPAPPVADKPATLPAAKDKPSSDLTPNEEIRQLRDRLAKLENETTAREAERKADETREAFLCKEFPDYPREFTRRYFPATTDRGVLHREAQQFRDMIRHIVQSAKPDFGGIAKNGGTPPSGMMDKSDVSPADLINRGLQERQQRGYRPNRVDQ